MKEREDFDAVTDIRDELIEKAKVTKFKNKALGTFSSIP